ncbi:radical SAM family heme chaperone HemW [Legionella jamestowniensis]|uniref:Heme chaperone HemW n=1 Tax=Legionella jamestowniensis TaxID=455 RepID=A0A0W0ULK0_9GAMM|nr:radical SAM family heme chaperone HemW [Legionella jamestowniensis]KTD08409.1 oxygen-independent coproporphyrinogen III oxidase [Legionella jamestowniensis]OCH97121.1 YggW family oxidoreductase [Legionella jamestowniensis]SFL50667.1 oxygen-independent coproporphyrinogen-3 oxidase [Legionella jamestowniensis DSM 19215]
MLPTSLYIHIPWCIRKCPYCDFNSHKSPSSLPEDTYVQALVADFKADLDTFPAPQEISSIFIGGGTPSLFSAKAYDSLLSQLNKLIPFTRGIEITLEANPGTVEQQRFNNYRQLGINRLSLGIQSFNSQHLKNLGRIHDDEQAHRAIQAARRAGFDNINIDLMHGLPGQTVEQGLSDLAIAINHQPEHLSWYQLTIEPNTVFYKKRPVLPNEDEACELEDKGLELLAINGFTRYEISAFCKTEKEARHNLNYWLFGDYYGIGAGAHGKLTSAEGHVFRTRKHRQPADYLDLTKPYATKEAVKPELLIFEFMLNTTRLHQPIAYQLFYERTGLAFTQLEPLLTIAAEKKLISLHASFWQITELGRRYTNDLQALFLPE